MKHQAKFKFQYIPDYSKFLLDSKLEEFTLVGIRFCREYDLPMMRPVAKVPEAKLIELSVEANKRLLDRLSKNLVGDFIDENIQKFVENKIDEIDGQKILDQTDIVAEDIILAFYIRRKLFSFFLHSYTQNAVLHTLIMSEVDDYTTREHLLTTKAFIDVQKKVMARVSQH